MWFDRFTLYQKPFFFCICLSHMYYLTTFLFFFQIFLKEFILYPNLFKNELYKKTSDIFATFTFYSFLLLEYHKIKLKIFSIPLCNSIFLLKPYLSLIFNTIIFPFLIKSNLYFKKIYILSYNSYSLFYNEYIEKIVQYML